MPWALPRAAPASRRPAATARAGWEFLALTQRSVEVTREVTLPALAKLGFVEGRNLDVVIEVGSAERMPEMTRRLLATRPDAILAIGNEALMAARAATATLPIVSFGPDPIRLGIEQNLARPTGNITGIAILSAELNAKRVDLLRELRPGMRRIGALLQRNAATPFLTAEMRSLADKAGVELVDVLVEQPADYPDAFARLRTRRAEALVIATNPALFQNAGLLARLAIDAGLPTICEWPEMARSGCLLGYGPQLEEERARLATFLARVLKGTLPRDIPFEQPAHIALAINQATARALRAGIPAASLARADEVIE